MWFLLAGLLGVSSLAVEDEHLLPEDSFFSHPYIFEEGQPFTGYYRDVLEVMAPAYERGVFARAIVLPSFSPEYAVYVSKNEDGYALHYLEPEVQLWGFTVLKKLKSGNISSFDSKGNSRQEEAIAELEEKLPDTVNDVPLKTCTLPLDNTLGEGIFVLWGEMLFRTRYEDKRPVIPGKVDDFPMGLDGTTYHFSFQYPLTYAGKIWSPAPASPTGKFAAIANQMRDICLSPDDAALNSLRENIDDLRGDLNELDNEDRNK